MATDRPSLEDRLREALHAEARQHPLRADFAASATASLPDRSDSPSAGWLRMALPSVAAVLVIAAVAAVAVISGLNPPSPFTSVAPSASGSPAASPSSVPGQVPTTFNGQPVYSGTAIADHIAADGSDASFFVGGWLLNIEVDCVAPPTERPSSELAPWCPSGWFLTETRSVDSAAAMRDLGDGTLHLIVGANVPGSGWQMADPVVLQVHAHDPQAAACPASIRADCEQAVVVGALVWSGGSEEPSSTPSPAPTVAGAAFWPQVLAFWPDGRTGLVGGTDGGHGRVERTTDGGATWSTVWQPDAPVTRLWAFTSTDAVAQTCAAEGADCALWHSTDAGVTWTAEASSVAVVSFADPQHGWALVPVAPPPGTAVGGPGAAAVERTSDGGQTWQPAGPMPCGPGTATAMGPTAITAVSATSAWLLCTGGAATIMLDKAVEVTTDGGTTWQLRAKVVGGASSSNDVGQISLDGHPSGIAVAPDGTAWMAGDRMQPAVSRDGGSTWTDMPLGEIDGNSTTGATPLDARRGLILMWDPNSQANVLEVTRDGGATWSSVYSWAIPGAP
jgi:photosystem II stability/assembly factor-like uncharacterized protein